MNYAFLGNQLLQIAGWSLGGMAALLLARYAYRLITPFDVSKELVEDRNTAVGASKAMFLIASGIMLHGILVGEKMADTLGMEIGVSAMIYVLCMILLGLGRMVLVATTPFDFNKQVHEADNLAVGLVEGAYYIAFAILIHSAL